MIPRYLQNTSDLPEGPFQVEQILQSISKEKKMGQALQLVNKYYEVTNERKDAEGIRPLVAADFTFVGPLVQTSGAEAYIALNKQFLSAHVETRMLQQFEAGDEVCSIYELDLRKPNGEIFTTKMADWLTIRDGRLAEQRIYYDPREFEKAFGM
jgi:ketosteroid isomerase-like protein